MDVASGCDRCIVTFAGPLLICGHQVVALVDLELFLGAAKARNQLPNWLRLAVCIRGSRLDLLWVVKRTLQLVGRLVEWLAFILDHALM